MAAPATPPTPLELNYRRWQARLAAAERKLRTRQLEAGALYPHQPARQQAHYARELAHRDRMAAAVAQARAWLENAAAPAPELVSRGWRYWLSRWGW